jgi:trigger factor
MNVSVEKLEKNLVKLNIEIDADVAAQEYNKACRYISEGVSIPGFRKGKAPRNVVEKYVGPEKIQREALNRLLPEVFADAVSENNFDIATEPQIESYDYKLGEPLKITAMLELKPEVKLNDYKGITVQVEEFKHPDDAMDKEMKALQDRYATLEAVTDRPTKNTDIVVMDFTGSVGDELIKGGAAKNYQLDLGNSTFIPGFAEQLVDKNINEDFTINVTFPEEYHDEKLKGQEARFEIKIHEIKEKKVPELNDEFAAKVGAFKTPDDLKNDISSYLEKTRVIENEQRTQKAIVEKIVEQAEVEIPDSMINKEAMELMKELQQKIQSQGLNWEQVLDQKGHETMWAELREEASKRIKNSLVLGHIAKLENISVTSEEFGEKIKELAAMYGTDEKTIYQQLSKNPEMVNFLTQQVMSQNITKFLVENNKVQYT